MYLRRGRAGYTLAELIVAMGILIVVIGIALPVLFTGDRALSRLEAKSVQTGAAASLLSELSRDLRGAHSVSRDGGGLTADGTVYRLTSSGTTRTAAGGADVRDYAGARFTVSGSGGLLRLEVTCGNTRLHSSVVRRNT